MPPSDLTRADVDAVKARIGPLALVELGRFDEHATCPKCHGEMLSKWREGLHSDCPDGDIRMRFPKGLCGERAVNVRPRTAHAYAVVERAFASVPEHLDRTCSRCGYGWAESVVSGNG